MKRGTALGATLPCFAADLVGGAGNAHAVPGDTHIYGVHEICTLDCDGGTLSIDGVNLTVYYHNGDPFLFDRERELGMTNRLQRVPA